MIKLLNINASFLFCIAVLATLWSCKENKSEKTQNLAISKSQTEIATPKTELTSEFKDYWYSGEAEITSYKLEQARYGEIGKAQPF